MCVVAKFLKYIVPLVLISDIDSALYQISLEYVPTLKRHKKIQVEDLLMFTQF